MLASSQCRTAAVMFCMRRSSCTRSPTATCFIRRISSAENVKPTRIGFIGLGNMGASMAINLIKAGHQLTVFDINTAALDTLQSHGATAVSSPAAVAAEADTVITMLPSSPHVTDVYLNAETGILRAARAQAIFIDSSTVDPGTARAVSAAARSKGCRMVDAPVSGGVTGAAAATLTFMVGGTQSEYESVKPLLSLMGRNIIHCGDSGTGQIAKIANNLVLGATMAALAEGMALGLRLGIDSKKLLDIINTSTGRCWSSEVYSPVPGTSTTAPSSREYNGGFGAQLMLKDLGLAQTASQQAGITLTIATAAQSLYQKISNNPELKNKDFSVIYKHILEQIK